MLKSAFSEGLAKAAQATSALVVTGGTNSGVMRLVGRALNDFDAQAPAGGSKVPTRLSCLLLPLTGSDWRHALLLLLCHRSAAAAPDCRLFERVLCCRLCL